MAEKGPETRMTPNTISVWGDLFMSALFWKRNTPPACAFKLKRCLVRFGDCPGISLVSDQGKEIQTTEPQYFHPAPPSHLPFHSPRTNKEVLKGPRWWHLVSSSLFQEWKTTFLGGIFLFLLFLLFLICPISPASPLEPVQVLLGLQFWCVLSWVCWDCGLGAHSFQPPPLGSPAGPLGACGPRLSSGHQGSALGSAHLIGSLWFEELVNSN